MDCCENTNSDDENNQPATEESSIVENKKASFKMNKKTFWVVVGIAIAILVFLLIWQTMKVNDISSAGNIASAASSAASSAATSSGGMVGGC